MKPPNQTLPLFPQLLLKRLFKKDLQPVFWMVSFANPSSTPFISKHKTKAFHHQPKHRTKTILCFAIMFKILKCQNNLWTQIEIYSNSSAQIVFKILGDWEKRKRKSICFSDTWMESETCSNRISSDLSLNLIRTC